MKSEKSYDIFISYRRKGGMGDARLLQQALKSRGYNVFFDYDSLRDGQFNEKIFDAIKTAPIFLLMLSKGALDNCVEKEDWVRMEIAYAIKCGCKIIPIALQPDCWTFPANLPDDIIVIKNEQISEFNKTALFEESIDRIIEDRFPLLDKRYNQVNLKKSLKKLESTGDKIRLSFIDEIFNAKENLDVDIAKIMKRKKIRGFVINECLNPFAESVCVETLSCFVDSVTKSPSAYNTKDKIDSHFRNFLKKTLNKVLKSKTFKTQLQNLVRVLLETPDFKLMYKNLWIRVGENDTHMNALPMKFEKIQLDEIGGDFTYDIDMGRLAMVGVSTALFLVGCPFLALFPIFSLFGNNLDKNKVLDLVEKYVERKDDIKESILEILLDNEECKFYDMFIKIVSLNIKRVKMKELDAMNRLLFEE